MDFTLRRRRPAAPAHSVAAELDALLPYAGDSRGQNAVGKLALIQSPYIQLPKDAERENITLDYASVFDIATLAPMVIDDVKFIQIISDEQRLPVRRAADQEPLVHMSISR